MFVNNLKKNGNLSKKGIGQRGFAGLRGANSVHFSSALTSLPVNMLTQ